MSTVVTCCETLDAQFQLNSKRSQTERKWKTTNTFLKIYIVCVAPDVMHYSSH